MLPSRHAGCRFRFRRAWKDAVVSFRYVCDGVDRALRAVLRHAADVEKRFEREGVEAKYLPFTAEIAIDGPPSGRVARRG